MKMKLVAGLVAASVAVALAGAPAWSNGRHFFEDLEGDPLDKTVYFGFVKDERGLPIKGAVVTVTITHTGVQFTELTDPIGVYKSVDVPLDVDPANVEVAVEADGYELAQAQNRTMTTLAGEPVQLDFLMQPAQHAAN